MHNMTEEVAHTTSARPILNSISAQLFVADIQASCDFYTDKLGFTVDFIYGDPPFYAQVTRDNAHLSFRHVDEPVFAGDIREREHALRFITVATQPRSNSFFRPIRPRTFPSTKPSSKNPGEQQPSSSPIPLET